jgi:hypothetical protein
MATITIVDELRRMAPLLLLDLINIDDLSPVKWNNEKNLDNSLAVMLSKLEN